MANSTAVASGRFESTLLIPENVVWLPYASVVLLVLFWLGFDFYRFHEKNKLKYARMRETQVVESSHNRKRINMISSKGLKYKNGLPDFGTVWNTSPSCSDISTPSPSMKKSFPHSTDISPSEDGGGLRMSDDEDGARTASEISPHADGGVVVLDDRRKLRAPRQAGSGGGGERFKDDDFGSQTSQGFSVNEGNSAMLSVTAVQKGKGRRSRDRSLAERDGTHEGGGGVGRHRRPAEDDELRFTESSPRHDSDKNMNMSNNNNNNNNNNSKNNNSTNNNDVSLNSNSNNIDNNNVNSSNNNNNNNNNMKIQASDGCVVGDMSTQTSYTVADLHYNPGRTSPQSVGDGTVYNHPGIGNPRVMAISPPSQGQGQTGGMGVSNSSRTAGSPSPSHHGGGHSSSSSPRSHRRSRHDSASSTSHRSPRPAATAEEFAAQSLDEELNKPIIIDFSRTNSARDERNQDSPSNPATPRHQSRRHEPRPLPDDYGSAASDRRSYDSTVPKDEAVFPGSTRKAPQPHDVAKGHESSSAHSRQHSLPTYSAAMASSNPTSGTSSKSRSESSVSKRHQQHHHQPQPPPPPSSSSSSSHHQHHHPQQQQIQPSPSRHPIQVESYGDSPSSPRPSRSARESRSRDRDMTTTSSSGRKQTETHYRHSQLNIDTIKDSRDSSSSTNINLSSLSAREPSRTSRTERSSDRSDSSSQKYKEPLSHRHPSAKLSSSSSSRQPKSARASTTASPRTSSDRRNRKSSDSSKHSSSESPKIPSHFYHQDEEGFFSSMSSTDHNSHARLDSSQQMPRRGIHFFSQLATGRRDSLAGFGGGGRKISGTGPGGGGFGEDDGDDYTSSSGYKGGGFDS